MVTSHLGYGILARRISYVESLTNCIPSFVHLALSSRSNKIGVEAPECQCMNLRYNEPWEMLLVSVQCVGYLGKIIPSK